MWVAGGGGILVPPPASASATRRGARPRTMRTACAALLVLLLAVCSVLQFLLLAVNGTTATTASFTCGNKTLPIAYVKDDYCDCLDGSDEPNTAACSLLLACNRTFACDRTPDGLPQLLFPSRVGDGVCDCCDGSDEREGFCEDTCEEQAQQFVEAAQSQYTAVLNGWRARNEALTGVQATLAEWEVEIAALEESLAAYAPVLSKLQVYKSKEGKAERWQRLAWLRKQAQMTQQQQQAQGREEAEEADSQQEEAEGTSGLQVRVLYDEEGPENVKRVLEGMVASEGGRTLSLKEYMEEQSQVEMGAKPPKEVPSMRSVFASGGALGPKDVLELNLKTMGALVLGPLKAVGWSFKVCLEEASAATGWSWDDTGARRLQSEREASPLARWWQGKVAPTTFGWVVSSFLQGPDAALALLRPDTIKGAPERLEAALLRSAVESIEEELTQMRERAQELRAALASTTYGEGHIFLAWQDQCFDAADAEHTYEVCPFKQVKQNYLVVGRWAGWGRRRPGADSGETVQLDRPEDVGRSLFFNEGQQCWNGPKRSVAVALACGAEERVVQTSEPSVCVYEMVLETPLLCDDALLAQAEARLAALGVETPQAKED